MFLQNRPLSRSTRCLRLHSRRKTKWQLQSLKSRSELPNPACQFVSENDLLEPQFSTSDVQPDRNRPEVRSRPAASQIPKLRVFRPARLRIHRTFVLSPA